MCGTSAKDNILVFSKVELGSIQLCFSVLIICLTIPEEGSWAELAALQRQPIAGIPVTTDQSDR